MDRYWQLLIHPRLPAALNMAVDWWMLTNLEVPTLRFYRWSEPTLSLGYRQQQNTPPELRHRNNEDLTLVVRPTGGGYLHHHRDLSYSVVLPSDHSLTQEGIRSSYGTICEPFLEAALDLGLLDEPGWGTNDEDVSNCLDAPAGHEPTVNGSKWMASAQVRKKRAVLQHGSLFWHEYGSGNFGDAPPHFLGSHGEGTSLAAFRDQVTQRLARGVFEDRTARPLTLPGETWNRIRETADQFRVDDPQTLPTFRRYGDS